MNALPTDPALPGDLPPPSGESGAALALLQNEVAQLRAELQRSAQAGATSAQLSEIRSDMQAATVELQAALALLQAAQAPASTLPPSLPLAPPKSEADPPAPAGPTQRRTRSGLAIL